MSKSMCIFSARIPPEMGTKRVLFLGGAIFAEICKKAIRRTKATYFKHCKLTWRYLQLLFYNRDWWSSGARLLVYEKCVTWEMLTVLQKGEEKLITTLLKNEAVNKNVTKKIRRTLFWDNATHTTQKMQE